ncbi:MULTISPECIES: hypothetical protein [unclassified Paenibacillus]|uniref:hypothetical protein n=1 Tax=unclassified Paenibacillus TaxID=185978 RepID=UPI00020D7C91|nr:MULTISPECIES: hypothetical protein [unclassified Paenibacillus]EGL14909.1 hypothetical protein HMPREF9413_1929 [Paenibacillus sp. HGF7]EPD82176.1 hypothetical protein HMPREF1207_04002 [Paenibacillus sp. HGH0039]
MVYAFTIQPGIYHAFEDEAEQIEQCKEWGLLSGKATKTKAFFYKGNGLNVPCTIVGYTDRMTAVIEFDNKQQHCIHPSYLKEMQAANYGQRQWSSSENATEADASEGNDAAGNAEPAGEVPADSAAETTAAAIPQKQAAAEPALTSQTEAEPGQAAVSADRDKPDAESEAVDAPKAKAKKEKAPKLQLPEEKVKMTAKVQDFTTVPNHFSDNDDEVIIYENVTIVEPETDIGTAWSSHSATLKKLELEVGDTITFEAKIVAKKLTRYPVPYKINNPAKIQKVQE